MKEEEVEKQVETDLDVPTPDKIPPKKRDIGFSLKTKKKKKKKKP